VQSDAGRRNDAEDLSTAENVDVEYEIFEYSSQEVLTSKSCAKRIINGIETEGR
jgi:hypothetical protein